MRKHGEKIYKSSSYRYRQLFTKVPCTQTTKLSLRYINRKHLDDLGRHLESLGPGQPLHPPCTWQRIPHRQRRCLPSGTGTSRFRESGFMLEMMSSRDRVGSMSSNSGAHDALSRVLRIEVGDSIFCHSLRSPQLGFYVCTGCPKCVTMM
jgi:hypothetical protein